MARRRYRESDDSLDRLLSLIIIAPPAYLALLWFTNRKEFWLWFVWIIIAAVLIFIGIIAFFKFIEYQRQKKEDTLLEGVETTGQEETVTNFINRFGKEGGKKDWTYRDQRFTWNRLDTLATMLKEKGVEIRMDKKHKFRDLAIILRTFIDKKEDKLTRESISPNTIVNKFSSLSGTEFENLLVRLYDSMGYSTQHTGKSGDQGADVIANKNGERILIQAKRYTNWNTGNAAVQQVFAAMKFYDCNKGIVISTSENFTREARELAKVTDIELVSKDRISELLMEHLHESWA
jgi:restriction system protein